MANVSAQTLTHAWCRLAGLLAMVLACIAMTAHASDADFVKRELMRNVAPHMSRNQRQAVGLAQRYESQKSRQGVNPSAGRPPAPAAAEAGSGTYAAALPRAEYVRLPPPVFTADQCVAMVAAVQAGKPDKMAIKSMQQKLIVLHFNPDLVDGVIGSRTRAAMMQFCLSIRYAASNDLVAMLGTHGAVYQAYPDWTATLASSGFEKWMKKQADAEDIGRIRRSGSADEVIAVLARYRKYRSFVPTSRADDALYSWELTEDDFKQLKSGEGVYKRIEALRGKPFASFDAFEGALREALKDMADAEPYVQLGDKYVEQQTGYLLDDVSFNKLRVANVPQFILDALQPLKGLSYPDDAASSGSQKLDAAVRGITGQLADRIMQFQPQIVKVAELSPSGARFTPAAVDKFVATLKDDPLAPVMLDKLRHMEDVVYQSDKTMTAAVGNVLKQVVGQVNDALPLVNGATTESSDYVLGAKSMAGLKEELKKYAVPEIYLELLADLKGVDYPDEELFWLATQAKVSITGSNNIIRNKIFGVLDRRAADRIDDAVLQELAAELPPAVVEKLKTLQGRKFYDTRALEKEIDDMFAEMAGYESVFKKKIYGVMEKYAAHKVDERLLAELQSELTLMPSYILEEIGTLQGQEFDDTTALEKRVDGLLSTSSQYEKLRPLIVTQARKRHLFDKTKTIAWSGGSCNCVHNNLAGEVYGFYPYWMAGATQDIDFSVLNRVGYDGLGFDDKGNLAHASRWSGLDSGFIREARTYGAKVDLVVTRSNWETWGLLTEDQKRDAFENLAEGITGLITAPLTNAFSRMQPYVSLGMDARPTMGDGVTLYFDGYPQDAESVAAFRQFIAELRDRLHAHGHGQRYAVNLMFRSSAIGAGIYGYEKLLDIMHAIKGGDKDTDSRFLVLLDEPTTMEKKLLRINVEDGLHGEKRMELLRSIVMAITFDGHSQAQLTDDIIYAKDNFGGIGFWPLPVSKPGAGATGIVSVHLHNYFLDGASAEAFSVCKYICPNKWVFRIGWGILALVLLVSVVMRFVSCSWRSVFDRHFIHFIIGIVVPTALLSLALLFCDPGWQAVSRGNSALILMVVLVIGYSIWNYQDKKRKANLP